MSPSLPTLSLVLVARDRGLWGRCGLRSLSGVPRELLSPRGGGSACSHPTAGWATQEGPHRDRQAGPGVERRTMGKESDLSCRTTLKELKIRTFVSVLKAWPVWRLTTKYCRWGWAGTYGMLPTCPAAAAAARHSQAPLWDRHTFSRTPLWGQRLLVVASVWYGRCITRQQAAAVCPVW